MNKKIASEIAVGIILIMAIIIGGIFWLQDKKENPVKQAAVPVVQVPITQPITQPTTQPADETANWQTHINPNVDQNFLNKLQTEIENWSNYKKLDNTKDPVFAIEDCSNDTERKKYESFIAKANKDVRKFEIAKFGPHYDIPDNYDVINLYITPNYDKVDEFKSGCSGGLGGIYPVATRRDYIIWGWLSYSSGYAPNPSDEAYNDFKNCEEIYDYLGKYFESNKK